MTRVFLIRHGETNYSLQNRYCGFSDPCLNGTGIRQAERLACRLRNEKIEAVYSSDLKRAYETAKIIFQDKMIEKQADFREMNFGALEGLTYSQIIQRYPELYQGWLSNLTGVNAPSGEGMRDLRGRVKKRLSFILSQHKGKTIAIVAHAGPIRVILSDALKYKAKMFWQIGQENGALNILEYSEKLALKVIKVNDTAHLLIKRETVG